MTATAASPADLYEEAPPQNRHDNTPVEHGVGIPILLELILKRRDWLDVLIRNPQSQARLMPRLLAISLMSFTLFGVAQALVFSTAGVWPRLTPLAVALRGGPDWPLTFSPAAEVATPFRRWLDGSAFALIAAYVVGLIAASGICLPSLYFYGLLAGVRLSMFDVVLHTLKAKATAAVALIGILPIYAALALGIVIFPAPTEVRTAVLGLGLTLPFIAGLWGTWSLYRGFLGLTDTLSAECRDRRTCFLRRLVLAWSACYTAVTPVLIFTLWQNFDGTP